MKANVIMKVFALSPLLLGLASSAAVTRKADYDGYQVIRLQVGDNLSEVQNIIKTLSLSTWNGGPKLDSEVDVVVPGAVAEQFEADTVGLSSQVMHANLGESIAREADYPIYQGRLGSFALSSAAVGLIWVIDEAGSANSTWFNSYHPYADHVQFLNDLRTSLPANSEIITSGNSLQGRPITGIHLFGSGGKATKPAIILHGTVHAREWITTMVFLSQYIVSGT